MKRYLKIRNRKGFTLGELITTVAIIGSIAAMTVPQYLRYRADTNEELVRQYMRLIGEKMVEILGREGSFPTEAEWADWSAGNPTGANEDELSITASLAAIDDHCYTTDDYYTESNGSAYRFCSQPQSGACGKYAGTKRFCVHYHSAYSALFAPSVVGEMTKWNYGKVITYELDPAWINSGPDQGPVPKLQGASDLQTFAKYNTENVFDSAENLAGFLEAVAYTKDSYISLYRSFSDCAANPVGQFCNPDLRGAINFDFVNSEHDEYFKSLLPETYQLLQERGITLHNVNRFQWVGSPNIQTSQPPSFFIAFDVADPPVDINDAMERCSSNDACAQYMYGTPY